METKLNWEKFEPLFGTWASKLKPFFISGGFDSVYEALKKDGARGIKIAPLPSQVYRAFQETPINNVNVVLLSMCPYHTFYKGVPVADGLTFSCSITGRAQPSLEKVWEAWEEELYDGLCLECIKNPNLNYLSRQGVLLLNSSLTVAEGKPSSHADIWHNFTKFILEECLSYTGIPIVMIGKDAQKFEKYVTPLTHGQLFKIEHPAFAARNQSTWDTKNCFRKVTQIVKENNNYEIKWFDQNCPS